MTLEEAYRDGKVKLGDHFNYPIDPKMCKLTSRQTGINKVQVFKTEKLEWVLDIFEEELILVPTEATMALLILYGRIGYECGIGAMDECCKVCYTNQNLARKVIAMSPEVYYNLLPEHQKTNGIYWLRKQVKREVYGTMWFGLQLVSSSYVDDGSLYSSNDNTHSYAYAVRPTVYLKSNLHLTSIENVKGSKENPWDFVEAETDEISKMEKMLTSVPTLGEDEFKSELKKFIQEEEEVIQRAKKELCEMEKLLAKFKGMLSSIE